jgi:hypothetical protein
MQKTVNYLQLIPDGELPEMKDATPFLAILILDDEVTEMWQWEASRWLVAAGCRFMLAWGKECEAWHDSVDDANLEAFDYEDIPEDRVVMTTWHEDEDLEEVFWFAKHRAAYPAFPLNRIMILHVAAQPRKEALEAAWADA